MKEVEDCTARSDHHLKEATRWELKLKEELVTLGDSSDTQEIAIQELES